MSSIPLLVVMMASVTYIPRLIPLILLKADRIPEQLRTFLSYIPYAVLSGLIIPDGFNGLTDRPLLSGSVLVTAALVSWFKGNVILSLAVSVSAAWLLQIIFPL